MNEAVLRARLSILNDTGSAAVLSTYIADDMGASGLFEIVRTQG